MSSEDSPECSGLLSKRRGGLGKLLPNAWQNRFFTVSKDGILSYYDTDRPPDYSTNDIKPRGRLDLKNIHYEIVRDLEGAPTMFGIHLCPPNDERWRLCADSQDDLNRWCLTFEKFQKSPKSKASPTSYTSDEEDVGSRHKQTQSISTKSKAEISSPLPSKSSKFPNSPSLPPSVSSTSTKSPSLPSPAAHAPPHQPPRKKAGLKVAASKHWVDPDTWESLLALLVLNLCVLMIVASSHLLLKFVYFLSANLVLGYTLLLRERRVRALDQTRETLLNQVQELERKLTSSSSSCPPPSSSPINPSDPDPSSPPPSASSEPRTPIAGETLPQVSTLPAQSPDHSWCKVDHRQFNVRIGPNYSKYGKKAPSGPPLYEPVAVDVFCASKRIDHAAQRFVLPDTSDYQTDHPHVPPLFIVQIQIPSEPPPSLFTSVEDGPGWAILLYFRITEDTRNQLKDLSSASPAVKLFAQYCKRAFEEPAFRGRFKVICSCSNIDVLGMPSAITAYNAKPVLIRRTGTLFRGEGNNYIEKDIHVHKFASLAKQSIHLISSKCGLMYMQIGFVIEGKEDSELPEVLFGCVGVNKPQEDQADFLFE